MTTTSRPSDLADRAVAATGWRFGTVAVQLVLQLLVLGILSRLLPPEDFGVLAIAMVFVNFATVVSDLGAGAALIQRRELSPHHVRSALTFSIGVGLLLALVLGLGAPWWAALFHSERAVGILRFLSVTFLLNASALVPSALLWRGMRIRAFGVAEVTSFAVGYGAIGITLASQGFGIWALAWAVVVQSAVRTVMLFGLARQLPVPGLWWRELGEVLGFGLGVSLTKLFNFAATKGDYVVVGRWLGGEALGLYERAYRLMEMPATYFAGVLERVLFPALSEIQDDQLRLRRGFEAALASVILVYAPAAVALGVAAPHLIRALFGSQWTGAVLPLQVLSVGLLFRGAHKICDAVIRAKGAVYRSAWRVSLYALAVVIGAGVGTRWGIAGVAAGVTVAIVLRYALVAGLAAGLLEMGWESFLRCHAGGAFLATLLVCALVPAERFSRAAGLTAWIVVAVLTLTTVATIGVGLLAMPSAWIGRDLQSILRRVARRIPGLGRWIERLLGGNGDGRKEAGE